MAEEPKKITIDSQVPPNFIKEIIEEDLKTDKHAGRVATRFPPEPNGYLHIGHAKSICLNFGLALEFNGTCNLRFDDTNPSKESTEYVESIKEDIRWLGFDWGERECFASDYFEQLYEMAVKLIEDGKAYVDDLSEEQIKEYRGDYYTKAKPSPYKNRSVEENLDLFKRMRAGEFADGAKVLRAKVDLDSSNMNMRDPVMYRIRRAHHHRTGDKWCIYPMYDFAHGQSDAIEHITHSLCSLEFQNHRPLYDWFTEAIGFEDPPRQIEFARLNLNYTVMSKRKLLELVEEEHVEGWSDPRMPTISGLRRRGYTPKSIRTFAERIGVAKADSIVDMALLEYCIREDLNETALRVMAVLKPLRVVIENYPADQEEFFDAPLYPEDASRGTRKLPFSRELYVEREDFREDAPKKWHRLAPGREVRLRYACLLTCREVIKDDNGEVVELRCTFDPESRGGTSPDGRKVKGTLHWVSAKHAKKATVRLYDRLFNVDNPMKAPEGGTWKDNLNPDSLETIENAYIEPYLKDQKPASRWQFERLGYFTIDPKDSSDEALVFNRTVTLRDSWARIEKAQAKKQQAAKTSDPKPKQKKPQKTEEAAGNKQITIDALNKVDLLVGEIVEASLVEEADKLLKLMVDIGEEKPRQIFSGIRKSYPEPAKIVGKQVIVVANLKPRKMRFGVSEGMVMGAGDGDRFFLTAFDGQLKPGDKVS